MKIELDRETMPDELYNILLQNFVQHALELGLPVNKHSQFEEWSISCNLIQPRH